MKVTVNVEVANKIYDIIRYGQYKEWTVFEEQMMSLKESKGIDLMLSFYNAFDYETYLEVLFSALNNKPYDSDNDLLMMMHSNLKRLIEYKSSLADKMASINQYDFLSLEKKLDDKLPNDTHVDVEIYFVFDGINGGSIVDNNKMLLNTMLWPSNDHHLDLIEGILLHEYHHIGLLHWLEKYDTNFRDYKDGPGLAKYLMLSIMSEGSATYFFNDGHDIYPLVVESHGEETASSIREGMQNRGEHIEQYIKDLQRDIQEILSYQGDIEDLDILSKYTFSSTSEPLDKSIGYHMCSVIENKLGLTSLLDCFVNPHGFIHKYNESLEEANPLRYSDDFMRFWHKEVV